MTEFQEPKTEECSRSVGMVGGVVGEAFEIVLDQAMTCPSCEQMAMEICYVNLLAVLIARRIEPRGDSENRKLFATRVEQEATKVIAGLEGRLTARMQRYNAELADIGDKEEAASLRGDASLQ